ncbi:MAG: hypothetical protein QMC96_05150 [Methanomicrobiales archaeon]|nr:hypothetical protein [Methanomicrobiales archaeon]
MYIYDPPAESYGDTGLHSPIGPNNQPAGLSHIEVCYDYELNAIKTANAEYTRTYTWTIDKRVDNASHSGFAGETFNSNYEVALDQTVTDSDWIVRGTIVVTNPSPFTVGFTVSDSVGGTVAVVNCPTYTLGPGASTTCTYSADLTGPINGTNTATITSLNSNVGGATATADYTFGDPTTFEGYGTVNVEDSVQGALGSASGDKTFEYSDDFTCPTNASYYTNGVYKFDVNNTATISETGQSDDATVTVTCYAPVVSKNASASYDEIHNWSIEKSVDPLSQGGLAGDTLDWTWQVNVSETTRDSNFAVWGTISIYNPADKEMTVTVADVLNDSTPATVDCGSGSTSLTVAAKETGTCTYRAEPTGKTATLNTATATLNGAEFIGTASVNFVKNVIGGTATVTDGQIGLNVQLTAGGGPRTFTGNGSHTCSLLASDYTLMGGGSYMGSEYNPANVTDSEGIVDRADATTIYNCFRFVGGYAINKTAVGTYNRTVTWELDKSVDDASHEGFAGDKFESNWTVVATKTEVTDDYKVTGAISIYNPASYPVTVTVSDVLNDGTSAQVTCPSYTIEPGSGMECTYIALPSDKTATKNTATVTYNGEQYNGYADVEWTENRIGYDSGTLSDTRFAYSTEISGTTEETFSETFTCPADASLYENGVYTYTENNTAILDSGIGLTDSASVTVTCYAPVVSKTAAGTYDERHEWDVEKTVDPVSQSGFVGDTVPFTWTIKVTESVFEENFDIAGTIIVQNPAPMAMTIGLTDVLSDDTTAEIGTCTNGATYAGGSLTIPASTTTVCSYTADNLAYSDDAAAPNGNTATATLNGIEFIATDPIEWSANVIRGDAALKDLQGPLSETISGSGTWTIEDAYTCSVDTNKYASDYSYTETIWNTATVTSEEEEQDSSTTSTAITCYIPEIGKTAAGTYNERHEWDVEKTVDPMSQSAFAGDTVGYEWTVVVTEEVFEEDFVASGTITVVNHNPEDAMTVALSDVLSDTTVATITACTGDADLSDGLTVAAGESTVCDYSAVLAYGRVADAPTCNTATAVLNGISFSASDAIEWTANVIRESVTLDDDQNPAFPLNITEGGTWTYAESYTCSVDKGLYEGDNTYTYSEDNTATVWSEPFSDSSTAATSVNCYVPTISKTAAGTYDERHEWNVTKSVEPESRSGYPGDTLEWTWMVTVIENVTEGNFDVTGIITVVNPNPEDALIVSLTDELKDGTSATIGSCSGGTLVNGQLTVPAGGTAVCDYEVLDLSYTDDADAPTSNTATAVMGSVPFTATDTIEWAASQIDENATLVDQQGPLNEALTGHAQAGSYAFGPFSYSDSHTCSNCAGAYGTSGAYGDTLNNVATVTGSDGWTDSDAATTTYTCEAGYVDLLKLTGGVVDPTRDWQFALYEGPDGFGTTAIATDSTLNDADGMLDFGAPALRPDTTYTVCEMNIPDEFEASWQVDTGNGFVTVIPYNPNADDAIPVDLGNRCVDFGPDTTIPVTVGTTVHFQVNNTPKNLWCGLTIGFWKNNIYKYLNGENGRQVCDEFFETVKPADVCSAVRGCTCSGETDCDNWTCIYDRIANYNARSAREKAEAQMLALFLTSLYYEEGFGFVIDINRYEPIDYDSYGEPIFEECYYTLEDAIDEAKSNSLTDLWGYVQDLYDAGEFGKAYEVADCLNNYKFGCCQNSDDPECEIELSSSNPCTFDGLTCNAPRNVKPEKTTPAPKGGKNFIVLKLTGLL